MEYVSRTPEPDETAIDYALIGGDHAERGRRLFVNGMSLLAVALVYLGYTANVDHVLHTVLGLLIFTLSLLPSLLWARAGGSRFPVFETILMLCTSAYALPLLNAREQLADYSAEVITRAGIAVIVYQVSGILTYAAVRGIPGRTRFWRESMITRDIERFIVYGLILSSVYVAITTFTTWVPADLNSVLRAVFYGVGILCTFVSSQRWGRGEMLPGEKNLLLVTLVPQLIMMCLGLLLVVPLSLIAIAVLGYLSGGKRVPWLVLGLTLSIFGLLHAGKGPMRTKYWDNGYPPPTITEVPAFFSEWIEHGLTRADSKSSNSRKLLERTSLMHILCLVVTYTPDRQDYLYGKTYGYVLPQLIPRLFWPGKPRSHVATYELGIYYGLQDEEATQSTTIAFGLLTEAYANFGFAGAILLGCFWGFWLKKLQIWSTFSPMFSFAGLLMILLTAWSFNAELTMAAWVSSFEQAVLVVLGVPMVLRSLFGL
jgi:hypothetical protein